MYTGASCGTWISPRNPYVALGACSWESRAFTTMVTSVLDVCAPHVLYNTPRLPNLERGALRPSPASCGFKLASS
eukprot:3260655-Pyramimonas_sp.AAC.1